MDYMEQGIVDLKQVTTLVLDEADRMLDMGFLPAMKRIVGTLTKDRQTMLFSATMSMEIEKIAQACCEIRNMCR
jgi:Superfamily II DNA and RNA helicases